MNKIDKWYYGIMVTLAVVALTSMSSCSIYKTYKGTEMVKAGVDPLYVGCLLHGFENSPICAILAAKK